MNLACVWLLLLASSEASAQPPVLDASGPDNLSAPLRSSTARAIDWLTHAVPKWLDDHHCGACHHQGDAARALLLAIELGELKDASTLVGTLDWCAQPEKWQQQIQNPQANDYRLADIQFASTLTEAHRLWVAGSLRRLSSNPSQAASERINPQPPQSPPTSPYQPALDGIAGKLVKAQNRDGSWSIDNAGDLASPITQGSVLLTGKAASVLLESSVREHRPSGMKAWHWLCTQRPNNVFEASSLLIALSSVHKSAKSDTTTWPNEAEETRQLSRRLLDQVTESPAMPAELGFGPYVHSSAENFDTGLAILAMIADDASLHRTRIASGARYLMRR